MKKKTKTVRQQGETSDRMSDKVSDKTSIERSDDRRLSAKPSFGQITGQKEAVHYFQTILRRKEMFHAYLLSGEKGSGKKDLALAFAAALLCEHPREQNGMNECCGKCHSCRMIEAGSHPDVIWVNNETAGIEKKTDVIGVDVARYVQQDAKMRPSFGKYKIYLVENAQNLNPQAQNALLKTLEEPSGDTIFLLLAEGTKTFLPTILSRCILIKLRPCTQEELLLMLKQEGIEGTRALMAARLSHGNAGRCRELIREDMVQFRCSVVDFLKAMPDVDSREILEFEENAAQKIDDFLDFTLSWYRDILLYKSGCKDRLIFCEEETYIRDVAVKIPFLALEEILKAIDEAQKHRAANGSDTTVLEVLLLTIRRALRNMRKTNG